MNAQDHIKTYLSDSITVLNSLRTDDDLHTDIVIAAQKMIDAIKDNKKIICCGNGGSMSDAMHFAAELTGKYKDFRMPLPAIALSDPAALTCIANDFGYESVFARQVRAVGHPGDILLAISTSGKSKNIISAINAAESVGMQTVLLKGAAEVALGMSVYEISVPSMETANIQQGHIHIIHILVELIEQSL